MIVAASFAVPPEIRAQNDFTNQTFGSYGSGGIGNQIFGTVPEESNIGNQSFGSVYGEGGIGNQSFGLFDNGSLLNQSFGSSYEGGITNQTFGNEAPLGSGLIVLSLAGLAYAVMRQKYAKKMKTIN